MTTSLSRPTHQFYLNTHLVPNTPHNMSSTHFDIYENQAAQLPSSYTLVARKGR